MGAGGAPLCDPRAPAPHLRRDLGHARRPCSPSPLSPFPSLSAVPLTWSTSIFFMMLPIWLLGRRALRCIRASDTRPWATCWTGRCRTCPRPSSKDAGSFSVNSLVFFLLAKIQNLPKYSAIQKCCPKSWPPSHSLSRPCQTDPEVGGWVVLVSLPRRGEGKRTSADVS